MRIRIIGACGSGKSTLAKELSQKYGVSCYELDNLVWDRSAENRRFPVEVRDSKLAEILNREAIPRIMEMTAELADKRKMIKKTQEVEIHIQAHLLKCRDRGSLNHG